MNIIKTPLAIATLLAASLLAPSMAQAQLSFNLGAVSLYKSNGIDQDSRSPKAFRPAIQGGVDYSFGNGFYVGNWNSTGKFGSANVEVDLYGGYGGQISKDLTYDIGFASYLYPDNAGWNGNELYGSLTYDYLTVKLTRGVSGSIDEHSRLSVSVKQPLTDSLTLTSGLGWRNTANNFGARDYNLGLKYDLGNATSASAIYSGAQRDKVGIAGKGRLILGVSKSF
ncbi:MAG: TorF family putative porin [Gammaproteobacteria bacterium]|uniref:TorF family putative porin n=1 Tax=Rhodoferax sp. TaxID=50421 RepID=UPI00185D645F|nr:TorF family putative porin [Rhodoferax sp.]MBU3900487.1 TorF family putative porin [Gammaproteobacteria bacterium]MBA3059954.1 hypothetical protein [Rhodoferax sp.]MBU3997109.1 TorF family putative porin [Gammaproteobacteria bacterium]MBU4079932.1 TorF family putative porin [Gammaproteobacteria bacterium]MBU4112947.1 TorF family putative porin [Gammaproteobacteria bacterium]